MAGERVRIELERRDERGSARARRLRACGFVPGILYANGREAEAFSVAERELRRALTGDHGLHAILDVVLADGGKPRPAIVKDYQLDPVRDRLLHVDFQEVRLDHPIQSPVAVELVGEPAGVTAGGVLNQVAHELTVEALPMEIPDTLPVDVSELQIGDTLRAGDVPLPERAKMVDDPDTVVASVTQPTRIEVPEEMVSEEEAAAAAETPPEQKPESAAGQPAEPGADAGGTPGSVGG